VGDVTAAAVDSPQKAWSGPWIIAVTGMAREAAGIEQDGVKAVVSGGDQTRLVERFEAALLALGETRPAGVMSIGLGGGLDPTLRPGDAVLAEAVLAGGRTLRTDPAWTLRIKTVLPNPRLGLIAGQDAPVTDPQGRREIFQSTGALCVDMESHTAGRLAEANGLPFAAVRFISDGAERRLPKAALAGLRPDGGVSVAAVIAALALNPFELPGLIRTGIEAEAGFKALFGGCGRLGPALGFGDV